MVFLQITLKLNVIMPRKCMVSGCSPPSGYIKMHRFTRNPELFAVWLEKIGRHDLMNNPTAALKSRICTRHFSAKQRFVCHANARTDLRPDAIPDKYIPTTVAEESVVVETVEDVIDVETHRDCEIIVCGLEDIPASVTDTLCETIPFFKLENADYTTSRCVGIPGIIRSNG